MRSSWVAAILLVGCGSSADSATSEDGAIADTGATADTSGADASADAGLDTALEATSDAPTDAPEAPLDCSWVNDPNNCWRTFVAAVDKCLKNPVASGVHGSLAADHKSCTYPSSGRTVAFATLPTPDGEPDRADRDSTVSLGGTTCLHFVEVASVNGFTVTAAPGTLTYLAIGNDVRVQCPDGTRFRGDAVSIAKLCGSALLSGGAPGRTAVAVGGEVRLQLTGMKDVAFDCVTP